MPPKPKKRPDYPSEVARRAQATGIDLLVRTLGYLKNPTGHDAGKVWPEYVERANASLEELQSLELPLPWNAAVPQAALDAFERAAKVSEDVKIMTLADEGTVIISGGLVQLRAEARAAARQPPTEPYKPA